jgi:hypothetical protein
MLSFSSPRLFGTDGVDGHCSMTGTCAHALQRENGLWEITPGAMAGLLLYTTLHFNSKNSKNSDIYNSAMYIYMLYSAKAYAACSVHIPSHSITLFHCQATTLSQASAITPTHQPNLAILCVVSKRL